MRTLTYELASPDGSQWKKKSGDLVSLLIDCPFFFVGKVIPPMQALNEFLRDASDDASISGAACRWSPFQLELAEYSELVSDLQRREFQLLESPDWVSTYDEWKIWCGEVVWGIPSLERRKLHEQKSELERRMQDAREQFDYATTATLLKQFLDLQIEEAHLIDRHRLPQPRIPTCRAAPCDG